MQQEVNLNVWPYSAKIPFMMSVQGDTNVSNFKTVPLFDLKDQDFFIDASS